MDFKSTSARLLTAASLVFGAHAAQAQAPLAPDQCDAMLAATATDEFLDDHILERNGKDPATAREISAAVKHACASYRVDDSLPADAIVVERYNVHLGRDVGRMHYHYNQASHNVISTGGVQVLEVPTALPCLDTILLHAALGESPDLIHMGAALALTDTTKWNLEITVKPDAEISDPAVARNIAVWAIAQRYAHTAHAHLTNAAWQCTLNRAASP